MARSPDRHAETHARNVTVRRGSEGHGVDDDAAPVQRDEKPLERRIARA
jgi:hypothetical protein